MFNKSVPIIFSTGTDEHGSKIQQAALNRQESLPNYCDSISAQFENLLNEFSIEGSEYIRTTSEVHKKTVKKLWVCSRKTML